VDRSRIPEVKPPIERLWLDDLGYLWTRRTVTVGPTGAAIRAVYLNGRDRLQSAGPAQRLHWRNAIHSV
jgi:hypothetical protein